MGNNGERSSMHKVLATIMDRLDQIEANQRIGVAQSTYMATLAGVSEQMQAIAKHVVADINNPAQPVPDPAPEQPYATTQQAATPEAYDNVQQMGATPGSTQHLRADTTDVPMNPGVSLPTQPFNQLLDVTAPVDGTQYQRPTNETRIETDVRVGNPDNPEVAYPWTIGQGQATAANARFAGSMKLAQLRVQAGMATGDEFGIAAQIEASSMSNEAIAAEINTISSVRQASAATAQRPRNLVPRAAAQSAAAVPSMSSHGSLPGSATTAAQDTTDADLFDF